MIYTLIAVGFIWFVTCLMCYAKGRHDQERIDVVGVKRAFEEFEVPLS